MKILFQGDSITDGNRGRTDDPNHIMGHGFAFSIASRLGAKYPAKFEFINKGNSGDEVLKLLARWRLDAVLLKPDLVSILIGTNDINIENPPSRFETIYRMLLDDLPDSRFILCEPFRFRIMKMTVSGKNVLICLKNINRLCAGSPLIIMQFLYRCKTFLRRHSNGYHNLTGFGMAYTRQ